MDIQQLRARLQEILDSYGDDPEMAHVRADEAVLAFIAGIDEDAARLYDAVPKWYA
jgi:hypothetical protein